MEKIRKNKAPPRATFFAWTASLSKILKIENLRKHKVIAVDWCCTCNKSGEIVDHFLLHCGCKYVMGRYLQTGRVGLAYACNGGRAPGMLGNLGRIPQISTVWKMILICIMWYILVGKKQQDV